MTELSDPIRLATCPRRKSRRWSISSSVVSGLVAVADSLFFLAAGAVTYATAFGFETANGDTYGGLVCFVWVVSLLLFQFCGLYRLDAILHPVAYLDRLIVSAITAVFFFLAAALAFRITPQVSLVWVGAFALASYSLVIASRLALPHLVLRLVDDQVFVRHVVISGSEDYVARLLERFGGQDHRLTSVLGVFVDAPTRSRIRAVPVLGAPADVDAFVRREMVDDVILALPWSEDARVLEMVRSLRELPVNVYLGADLVGLAMDFGPPPDHFAGVPVASILAKPLSGWAVAVKALEDYVLGSLILLVALPVMAVIAVAIKLDDSGPVLFRQKRLGFNNKQFDIYKFRSMRYVAEPIGATIQATPDDERVTGVGRFIRRWSLDELPQLFNVINGTMSLVGPRPHAIDHNEEYARTIRGYFARHRVKPGLTGWAQVCGWRGQTDTPEKIAERVRHDIYYTENWSLLFDLRILARTFLTVLNGQNAH